MAGAAHSLMRVEVCPTADDAGAQAARLIAEQIRSAVAERGGGSLGLSGGRTPAVMMRVLASSKLPWRQIHIFQVDERVVADDDARRNLIGISTAFSATPIPPENIHAMPVDSNPLGAGATRYYNELCANAGTPPRIEVIHLGLGEDGHTASLVAGDDALEVGTDVTITDLYKGVRRMTLTLKALDRARCRVWLVTGTGKRDVVRRFLDGDPALVAGRVRREAATIVLDRHAAGE